MAARSSSVPFLFGLILVAIATTQAADYHFAPINRTSFPLGFVFGAGSAAYQTEGAAFIQGKGLSVWDTFSHKHKEKIADHSNGDVADDMYHRYKADIVLMKNLGLDAFRFSISWSRILPKGRVSGGVNAIGVKFYNNLINELLSKGLTPYVTLFHWDLPQALEDEYGGFLNSKIVDDFHEYADFCFKTFGDRVKYWFTLNEPYTYCFNGYARGTTAPGRCSNYIGKCEYGNSATEPYIVAHNLILAHSTAVQLYRQKYKAYQKGKIGVTLVTNWFVPFSEKSVMDNRAAERSVDFMLGWFLYPMTYGEYPMEMQSLVGERLPKFRGSESELLKKSYDVLGVNYYTTNFAAHVLLSNGRNLSMTSDGHATLSSVRNGVPIGTPTDLDWLYVYPKGIRALSLHIKEKYGNPPVYITENGLASSNNNKTVKEILNDKQRIIYHYGHLSYLLRAIKEGANVKGYFIWSFLDEYEWDAGYTVSFGIIHVDVHKTLTRMFKSSAFWFRKFLMKN